MGNDIERPSEISCALSSSRSALSVRDARPIWEAAFFASIVYALIIDHFAFPLFLILFVYQLRVQKEQREVELRAKEGENCSLREQLETAQNQHAAQQQQLREVCVFALFDFVFLWHLPWVFSYEKRIVFLVRFSLS